MRRRTLGPHGQPDPLIQLRSEIRFAGPLALPPAGPVNVPFDQSLTDSAEDFRLPPQVIDIGGQLGIQVQAPGLYFVQLKSFFSASELTLIIPTINGVFSDAALAVLFGSSKMVTQLAAGDVIAGNLQNVGAAPIDATDITLSVFAWDVSF